MAEHFYGRDNDVKKLEKSLVEISDQRRGNVEIISISGPGGVGKTFLLDHCISKQRDLLRNYKYMILRTSSSADNDTLTEIVARKLPQSAPGEILRKKFSKLKLCLEFVSDADREAREKIASMVQQKEDLAEETQKIIEQLGLGLVEFVFNKHFAEYAKTVLDKNPTVVKTVTNFVLKHSDKIFEKKWFLFNRQLKLSLSSKESEEYYAALAGAMIDDLNTIFEIENAHTDSSVKKLLLIIDDYERSCFVLGDFLANHLIPRLESADFSSKLVVLSRDVFYRIGPHKGFSDKIEPYLICDIQLQKFEEKEADEFLQKRGVDRPEIRARIINETMGYPFMLSVQADSYKNDGYGAVGQEEARTRLTRWLTHQQQRWLEPLCFLEIINKEAIEKLLPGEEWQDILSWLKADPSIRIKKGDHWQIFPIVRNCIKHCVRNDSLGRFDELVAKCKPINEELIEKYSKPMEQ